MYYNQKLISTLEDRFSKVFSEFDGIEDLYSFIASIMYDKKYVDCFEPDPLGKELRERAKQFILPIVEECGGLLDGEEVHDFPWYREIDMEEKIIEVLFTSGEPVNLKAASVICGRLQRYNEIKQIIEEYKKGTSRNTFTNDKYFRRILEVFEVG